MKNFNHLAACFFFFCGSACAQNTTAISNKIDWEFQSTESFAPPKEGQEVVVWPFKYSEGVGVGGLKNKIGQHRVPKQIQLVYTKFSRGKEFNQDYLNRLRLQRLAAEFPEWLDDPSIEWELIEQKGCNDFKSCDVFFHGFVITLRPVVVEEKKVEIDYRVVYLNNLKKKEKEILRDIEIDNALSAISLAGADPLEQYVKEIPKDFMPEDTGSIDRDTASNLIVLDNKQVLEELEERAEKAFEKISAIPKDTVKKFATATKPSGTRANAKHKNDSEKQKKEDKHRGSKTRKEPKNEKEKSVKHSKGKFYKERLRKKRKENENDVFFSYWMSLFKKRDEEDLRAKKNMVVIKNGCADGCRGYYCCDPPIGGGMGICKRNGNLKDPPPFDGTVTNVLERHGFQWDKINFTVDVTTGMMLPYAEFMIWLGTRSGTRHTAFVSFYNDGDNTPDSLKEIGRTKGIYGTEAFVYRHFDKYTHHTTLAKIGRAACTAIRSGDGGDVTDNHLEAILQSERDCAECGPHVLIADNRSPIRDMILLPLIQKPVLIILPFATAEDGLLNTEYLDIARKTKGAVYLKKSDLTGFELFKEGQSLQVQKYTYTLIGGKFECTGIDD